MKMKMNLGEGGIKGLLARHCEKIILGIIAVVALWVMIPSSTYTPIDTTKGAESLTTKASNANRHLQTDSWDAIGPIRFPTPDNYVEKAERSLRLVDLRGYPAEVPFNKPLVPPQNRRQDPSLYPVEKLEVAVVCGPVLETVTKPVGGGGAALLTSGADANSRPLPESVRQRLEKFMGANLAGVGAGGSSAEGTKATGYNVVAIKGLVPIKKQRAEYDSVFVDAADYDPDRDHPIYGGRRYNDAYGPAYYAVERAEVASDGSIGKWAEIGTSRHAKYWSRNWSPANGDKFVDANFVHPEFTMALPPVLLRDLEPLARHSAVPRQRTAEEIRTEEATSPSGEAPPSEFDSGPGGSPMGTAAAPPSPAARPVAARPPRSGSPGPYGRMEGSNGGSGQEQVDYWLFRFFDMTAQEGKSYVYRVKLFLEDPNSPPQDGPMTVRTGSPADGGNLQPQPKPKPAVRHLSKEVVQRLERRENQSDWWREAPYSQVSEVVRIPTTMRVLAGAVDAGKVVKPIKSQMRIRQSEETAKVMALIWDRVKAMDVAGTVEVSRGSVVNFGTNVEAIDPKEMLLRKMDYNFKTNNVVLDIRGGEPFGRAGSLTSPGEVLLMDDKGRLIVQNELDDMPTYRNHIFPIEEKPAAPIYGGEATPEGERPGRRPPRSSRPPGGGNDPLGLGG